MSKIYDYVINNTVNKNVLKSIDESNTSDFIAANVKITANKDGYIQTIVCGQDSIEYTSFAVSTTTVEVIIPVYKGQFIMDFDDFVDGVQSVTVTGNAQVDTEAIVITGDCEINVVLNEV